MLLKRRLLIRAGWPREALLITVVRDRKDEGHAVLTVKTDRGEFILDNQVDGSPAVVRDRLPLRQAPIAEATPTSGSRSAIPGRRRPPSPTSTADVNRVFGVTRPVTSPTHPVPRPVRARAASPRPPALFCLREKRMRNPKTTADLMHALPPAPMRAAFATLAIFLLLDRTKGRPRAKVS